MVILLLDITSLHCIIKEYLYLSKREEWKEWLRQRANRVNPLPAKLSYLKEWLRQRANRVNPLPAKLSYLNLHLL